MDKKQDTAGIIERLKWPESCPEIKRRLHDIANGITLRECADSDAHFLHDLADNLPAITQALTESSGQGTDGACCEAMREAAAKKVEGEVIHHRFRTWPWWGDGNRDKQDALVQFCDLCAKAIRALPPSPVKRDLTTAQADLAAALRTAGSLPDSVYVHDSDVRISIGTLRALAEATVKENRDAVIEIAATMVLGCIDHDHCRCDACNALRQAAATVRTLKSKQPDTGAGK